MRTRYYVTDGAYTTVGGTVFASSDFPMKIEGKQLALEGDHVSCPKCGRVGYIMCVEPRLSCKMGGKLPALEGDYCICGCIPPPELMANQSLSSQTVDGDGVGAMGHAAATASLATSKPLNTDAGQQFQFLDSETQQPLSGRHYLGKVNGSPVTGTTDDNGFAHVEEVSEILCAEVG